MAKKSKKKSTRKMLKKTSSASSKKTINTKSKKGTSKIKNKSTKKVIVRVVNSLKLDQRYNLMTEEQKVEGLTTLGNHEGGELESMSTGCCHFRVDGGPIQCNTLTRNQCLALPLEIPDVVLVDFTKNCVCP